MVDWTTVWVSAAAVLVPALLVFHTQQWMERRRIATLISLDVDRRATDLTKLGEHLANPDIDGVLVRFQGIDVMEFPAAFDAAFMESTHLGVDAADAIMQFYDKVAYIARNLDVYHQHADVKDRLLDELEADSTLKDSPAFMARLNAEHGFALHFAGYVVSACEKLDGMAKAIDERLRPIIHPS